MPHTPLPVFSKRLNYGGHSRRFSVETSPGTGWHVRDERDAQVIQHTVYDDWHRVELAMSAFAIEVARLTREGWQEA